EVAYGVMKAVGAVLLVVMGVQSLWQSRRGHAVRDAGPPEDAPEPVRGWRRSYVLGLATCGANPKAAVFAMSFLPQFVPAGVHVPATLTLLAVVWVVVDTLWYLAFIWMVG